MMEGAEPILAWAREKELQVRGPLRGRTKEGRFEAEFEFETMEDATFAAAVFR